MKKKSLIATLTALVLFAGLGLFVSQTYAYERTITVKGINYISLVDMGKKYNLNVQQEGNITKLIGEAVNMRVSTGNNLITLNDKEFVAQTNPITHEGTTWVSALDWANLFNLALTHFDQVSQMNPTDSKPVINDAELDSNLYLVGDDWGNEHPEGVRKHGSPTNIVTPHSESPIYKSSVHNPEIQDKIQR